VNFFICLGGGEGLGRICSWGWGVGGGGGGGTEPRSVIPLIHLSPQQPEVTAVPGTSA
jgi:hypothetical protein